MISSSTLWLAPFLQLNVPYDPMRDFSPVTLATTSPNILALPTALAPGLPTVAAAGLPGYESTLRLGLLAPAGTPPTLIKRLHQETVGVLNRGEVRERLFNAGAEVIGSSPEEFESTVKSEMPKWAAVIRNARIRAE